MKFKCDSASLINGLRTVIAALPSKAINPVLDGVLVEADNNTVKLTCTDERMTIVATVNAAVFEGGKGVVPGKLFNEVVRGLSGGDVTVAMNDKYVFTVRGSGSRTNISGQDADLYPSLPDVNGEHTMTMPQDVLKRMIAKTAFAVAIEDMREVLTGAYIEFKDGTVSMVGLDGFRLALCKADTSIDDDCSAIIPGKAVADIGRMLSDSPDAFVNISIGGNKLYMRIGDTDVYATLISGEYINYKSIIPTKFTTRVTINVKDFKDAVSRAELIARQGNNNLLVLRISGNEMAIESRSEIGDVHEKIDVMQDGEDLNIAFNVKYLTDVVRNVADDEMVLNFTGAISPCTVTPLHDGSVTYLILPVRTSAA